MTGSDMDDPDPLHPAQYAGILQNAIELTRAGHWRQDQLYAGANSNRSAHYSAGVPGCRRHATQKYRQQNKTSTHYQPVAGELAAAIQPQPTRRPQPTQGIPRGKSYAPTRSNREIVPAERNAAAERPDYAHC